MYKKYLVTENKFSRPNKKRLSTDEIIVHFSQGPGQTALKVRDFLEHRLSYGGYNFLVDDTNILQLTEDEEMAPHVGGKMTSLFESKFGKQRFYNGYSIQNWHTIGVCFCHPDTTGKPTDKTYANLVSVLADLCIRYNKGPDNLYRHYDVTGKDCPAYYVKNFGAWEKLKKDVGQLLRLK